MKRVISIFLLLLMLVVSIQPVLAVHFCGGRLHSIDLLNEGDEMSCCNSKTADCTDRELTSPQYGEVIFSQADKTCCTNYTVEIAVDTYASQQGLTIRIAQLCLNPACYLADNLLVSLASDIPLMVQHNFPPCGLARYGAGLLSLICILLI